MAESKSLCRVCLEDGATVPIFEPEDNENSVHSQLSLCVKEKIEDIDGYPRNICQLCQITLNNVCNFIKKYKESSKILEKGLQLVVKQEFIELNEYSYTDEPHIDIENIKTEDGIEFEDDSHFVELVSPLHLKIKSRIKKETKTKEKVKKKRVTNKLLSKNKTNRIASSILEGDFVWTGEKWCSKKQSQKSLNKTIHKIVFNNARQLMDLVQPFQEKQFKNKNENNTIQLAPIMSDTKLNCNLEGYVIWNEEMCLKSTKLSLPSIKTEMDTLKRPKGRIEKLKIPKVKKHPQPQSRLCDVCGQVFKTQERLTLHKNKVHLRNPVKCPTCFKVCASNYYLNRHMKRKHTETEKNFVCAICGRQFAFKGELSAHCRKVHEKHLTPKKQFACKLCNKTYACTKSVVIHERSVHTGERPAVCSVCGTSFYHEDYLKEHMRLHTGETPFKCPVCGRGYAQRCNMKSHIRIHKISDLDEVTRSKIKPNYLRLMKV